MSVTSPGELEPIPEGGSEQDIAIATVLLAGYTFTPRDNNHGMTRYEVRDPVGKYVYNGPTRYSCALGIMRIIDFGDGAKDVFPR